MIKMFSKRNLIILIVVIIICLSLSFLTLKIITPWKTQSFQAHVKVDNYVGINLDTDKLYFGTVTPGATGRRGININSPKDSFVLFSKEGPAASWIKSPQSISLFGEVNKSIEFGIEVPKGTEYGNYTAEITLKFYHPLAKIFLN